MTEYGRILIVDDLQLNRLAVSAILANAQIGADAVSCANDACEAVKRVDYSLVLMDIRMPECDGYAAAARLRQHEGGRNGPVIVALSAQPEDALRVAASGMDGFIARPIAPKALLARIEVFLKDRPLQVSEPVVWDRESYDNLSSQLGDIRVRGYLTLLLGRFGALREAFSKAQVFEMDVDAELHDLRSIAGTLGFQEVLTVCLNIQKAKIESRNRSFIPNLVGALERAITIGGSAAPALRQ